MPAISSISFIDWQTSVGYSIDSAQLTSKPILLDFYNPE
jgi:hypothetical protein